MIRVSSLREEKLCKPLVHTAFSYITKLRIYWDEERAGRRRITSAMDDSMIKFWFF